MDLVGSHFELFRQMRANIGPDEKLMSIEERDENLKRALMASRKLHPAVISPEAEYKVGIYRCRMKSRPVHLDYHCSLIRTESAVNYDISFW